MSFCRGSALEGCVHLARGTLSSIAGEGVFFLTIAVESWNEGDRNGT